MNSTSNSTPVMESSGGESAGGEASCGNTGIIPGEDNDMIDTVSPVRERWIKPDLDTLIPNMCYCESCRSLFYSRTDIFHHFLSDEHTGRSDPPSITEQRKGMNLRQFLECLLSLVLVEDDPKCFSNELFEGICESTLLGAPLKAGFGDFMMWIFTQIWSEDANFERVLLDKLFDSPKATIDWQWFWERNPLSRLQYRHIPPTICVYYDVNSNQVSQRPPFIDGGKIDYRMDGVLKRLFVHQNQRYLDDKISDFSSQISCPDTTHDVCCWDPDNRRTLNHFKGRQAEFYPRYDMSYSLRGQPLLGGTVFELYSISIDKIDPNREFSLIYMSSIITHDLPMIIYKCPPNGKKEDERGKPLPLKGPFRPPSLIDGDVFISFTKSKHSKDHWWFGLPSFKHIENEMGEAIDTVITHKCQAEEDDSTATIRYRVSRFAARAELTFTFVEEKGQEVYVMDGAITATDGNDPRTRRIIQQYSQEEEPKSLPSGQVVYVSRSEFGVPVSESYLRVEVKLVYYIQGLPDEIKIIQGCLDFPVPKLYSSQGQTLRASNPNSNTFLCVETSWTNPRAGFGSR